MRKIMGVSEPNVSLLIRLAELSVHDVMVALLCCRLGLVQPFSLVSA
jgi:hypothetical protein